MNIMQKEKKKRIINRFHISCIINKKVKKQTKKGLWKLWCWLKIRHENITSLSMYQGSTHFIHKLTLPRVFVKLKINSHFIHKLTLPQVFVKLKINSVNTNHHHMRNHVFQHSNKIHNIKSIYFSIINNKTMFWSTTCIMHGLIHEKQTYTRAKQNNGAQYLVCDSMMQSLL